MSHCGKLCSLMLLLLQVVVVVVTMYLIDFVSHFLNKKTSLQPLLFSPGLCLCGTGSPSGLDTTLRKPPSLGFSLVLSSSSVFLSMVTLSLQFS